MTLEALALEGETARIEALGADAVTQDDFVFPAPDTPRGNADASESGPNPVASLDILPPSPHAGALPATPHIPFSFNFDLHKIPPLPDNPDDPVTWSPIRPSGDASAVLTPFQDGFSDFQQGPFPSLMPQQPVGFPMTSSTPPRQSGSLLLSTADAERAHAGIASNEASIVLDTSVNLEGVPDWIECHYGRFAEEEVPAELEGDWQGLLRDWVALERAMDFGYMVSNLCYRPRLPAHLH